MDEYRLPISDNKKGTDAIITKAYEPVEVVGHEIVILERFDQSGGIGRSR
jgi:hypothetical protein